MRKFQVAWDRALADRVDSALGGLSRSAWLSRAAEYVLDNRVKLVQRALPPETVGCSHPKDRRERLPYGNLCGVCHILVR